MPALPQNNTARLWIDYTSMGVPHSAMHRYTGIASASAATAAATALRDFYKGMLPSTDGILGARFSAALTDFSTPVSMASIAGTGSPPVWIEDADAAFVTLPGRGNDSPNPFLLCFYLPLSFSQAWPVKNRLSNGQNALFDGIREAWAAVANFPATGVQLVNIAGDDVSFKQYLNFRKNSYRQTKQRRS